MASAVSTYRNKSVEMDPCRSRPVLRGSPVYPLWLRRPALLDEHACAASSLALPAPCLPEAARCGTLQFAPGTPPASRYLALVWPLPLSHTVPSALGTDHPHFRLRVFAPAVPPCSPVLWFFTLRAWPRTGHPAPHPHLVCRIAVPAPVQGCTHYMASCALGTLGHRPRSVADQSCALRKLTLPIRAAVLSSVTDGALFPPPLCPPS